MITKKAQLGILVPSLAACSVGSGGGTPDGVVTVTVTAQASRSAPPSRNAAVCRNLRAMDLYQDDQIVDKAMSPNGAPDDAGTPMTGPVMAALGRDARQLQAYAGRADGDLRSSLQDEAVDFTAASRSVNGTVSNDVATSADTAWKGISGACGS
jgi:hypothetical protein